MKKKIRKFESLLYKCIYCGNESKYSFSKLITHLDINHNEIPEDDKKELLKDLNLQLLRKEKTEKRELIKNKVNERNKIKEEIKAKELLEFKEHVICVLKYSQIDQKKLEIIKSRKNIEKVKRVLMFSLKKEFQIYLDDAGIDYTIISKKRNGKRKRKKIDKEYHDRTQNSIKLIYTPMGNKK